MRILWGTCLVFLLLGVAQAETDPAEFVSFTTTVGSAYGSASGTSTSVLTENVLQEVNVQSQTELLSAVNENLGLVNLNQASGNLNNQANVRALFLSSDPSTAVSLIEVGRSTEMSDNQISSSGGFKQDLIQGSLQRDLGIVGINQAAGSLNSQTNTLVLAVGGIVTLTEGELGEVQASNVLSGEPGPRQDIIRDSFDDTHGIVQVSQSAGDLNLQANTLGISFREITLR